VTFYRIVGTTQSLKTGREAGHDDTPAARPRRGSPDNSNSECKRSSSFYHTGREDTTVMLDQPDSDVNDVFTPADG